MFIQLYQEFYITTILSLFQTETYTIKIQLWRAITDVKTLQSYHFKHYNLF